MCEVIDDGSQKRDFMATAQNVAELAPMPERKPNKLLPPVWEGTEYPRYPPGIYDVRCKAIQGPEWLKNHRRLSIRLECSFLMEKRTVSGFLNLGDDPKRCNARKQSNYCKLWCKVNGGLPRKKQVMHWNDFVGKFFRVRIEDATKNSKGEPLSEAERYSKIVEFLECIGP
jgi:hypothetical protein